MHKIKIKPLSVNEAFKGVKYRTDKYKVFQSEMSLKLPTADKIETVFKPPYVVYLEFGLSSKLSDVDNNIKQTTDCLVKKYKHKGFDDRQIKRFVIDKEIVNKGDEYICFRIESLSSE